MPNAISCAYFAVRNKEKANEQNDGFKEAIGDIQTLRSADEFASCANRAGIVAENFAKFSAPVSNFLGKATSIARKLVYPLIVASGVLETVKSDDKVKTGIQVTGAISTMYTFESIATSILNKFRNYTGSIEKIKNNKFLRALLYIIRGGMFVAASISGYNIGKSVAGKAVDEYRNKHKDVNKLDSYVTHNVFSEDFADNSKKTTFNPALNSLETKTDLKNN